MASLSRSFSRILFNSRLVGSVSRFSSKTSPEVSSEPVKFSESKAATWKAHQSHGNVAEDEMPWFQPLAVGGSVTAILLWFCWLREENDMDQELGKTLYQRIPGMEEKQILLSIRYNEENGKDSTALRARLRELQSQKS